MMSMDIHKTRFEAVEICGVPALFTVERVRRSELPNGIFAYDMQTSEEDWSQPSLLACHITVEHYGTVLTGQRIDLPESGYRDLAADDFSWPSSTDRPTIAEFAQRHGLHIKSAATQRLSRPDRGDSTVSVLSTQAWHLVVQMPLVRGTAPKTPRLRFASQFETHFL